MQCPKSVYFKISGVKQMHLQKTFSYIKLNVSIYFSNLNVCLINVSQHPKMPKY